MDLQPLIDRLAGFFPGRGPFVSVYIDARPDQVGTDTPDAYVRSELKARASTYPERSVERESVTRDGGRIAAWLEAERRPRVNGIALFACSAEEFFEVAQLEVPIEETEVFVGPAPHLYPLVAAADRYRRHAAVVLDTRTAHIYVFALGEVLADRRLESEAIPRSEAGGWSQARYQRHVENFQRQHVRDVVQTLARIVNEENIDRIVVAANDVALPLLRAEVPAHLAGRIVEVGDLDMSSPRDVIFRRSLEAACERDATDDAGRVRRLLDAYRGGGLGVVGVDATLRALDNGQVHELLITADPAALRARDGRRGAAVGDELVAKARRTGAHVTIIEDGALLADAGGVGGLLRFRLRRAA